MKSEVYNVVKNASRDTLDSWIKKGIKAAGIPPLTTILEYKFDDAIFFNSSNKKCFLMILERDTSRNAKLDAVDLMFGNYENKRWNFYLESLPTMFMSRQLHNRKKPFTFKELSDFGRNEVIKGYYQNLSYDVNDKFFDYDISILKQMHVDFLNDK
ncbi:hypothetical protein [Mucilaginibacter sp.]|uniref:hypothetical protein n=1 Tax=Mucilaginibacter sp. TaxID=1882438 RepID=UPI0025E7E6D0|nr:hypothetical protein [Mucilaginibacter sp.]